MVAKFLDHSDRELLGFACFLFHIKFFMVIIVQIVVCLYACVQGALKQGQKDGKKNLQRQNVSIVMLAVALCS